MLTLKALHLIAVISWMVGLLYLPRLFVYHVGATQEQGSLLKIMEKRLAFFIIIPAFCLSWLFGMLLFLENFEYYKVTPLFHVKFLLALLLSVYTLYLFRCVSLFRKNENKRSAKFYRILNEVPTILLILIVFIAIVGLPG